MQQGGTEADTFVSGYLYADINDVIRVLIERYFVRGMERQLERALQEARSFAMRSPGYLSGETLVDLSDSHHSLVISTWRTRHEWQAWDNSDERRRLRGLIEPLLEGPEKITVYEVTLHTDPPA